MTVATFDTLKYANKLKAGGVPGPQAEVEAEALSEALQVNLKELVTKDDLKLTREELRRELGELRRELKDEIKVQCLALDKKLDVSVAKINGDIAKLTWMCGAMLAAMVGLLVRLFLYPGGHP